MTAVSNGGSWNSGTYIPFKCEITSITKADNAVVTTAVDHGFIVGNTVAFSIPKEYGMRQLNAVKPTVLAVTNDTVTLDVNTTLFDGFVIPTVPALQVLDPPLILPYGDYNTGYKTDNISNPALQIPGTYRNTYP